MRSRRRPRHSVGFERLTEQNRKRCRAVGVADDLLSGLVVESGEPRPYLPTTSLRVLGTDNDRLQVRVVEVGKPASSGHTKMNRHTVQVKQVIRVID